MKIFINCRPTNITMKATISAERYSIRPWPKGCSLSAGLFESLKPKIVIKEEAASERLLKASAMIAILETITPTESFIIIK